MTLITRDNQWVELPIGNRFMVAVKMTPEAVGPGIVAHTDFTADGAAGEAVGEFVGLPHGEVHALKFTGHFYAPENLIFRVHFDTGGHSPVTYEHEVPAHELVNPDPSLYNPHRKTCIGRAMVNHVQNFMNSDLTSDNDFHDMMQDVYEAGIDKLYYKSTACICFTAEGLIP